MLKSRRWSRRYFGLFLLLFGSVLLGGVIRADVQPRWDGRPTPIPEGARISITFEAPHHPLSLEPPRYFLGETVLVQFCVENTSTKPFNVTTGGDYRGAARATRFKVSAVDANGQAVVDPHPSDSNMGGLFGPTVVKPGGKFYQSLLLARYLRFDAPGEYTVRVKHDLGWVATSEKSAPVAEAKIIFVMPTAEQAQAVVEATVKTNYKDSRGQGEKTLPYGDISTLRYPVYMPLLIGEARKGSLSMVEAISGIATPEATQALIELMQGEDVKVSQKAAQSIVRRLPWDEKDNYWTAWQNAESLKQQRELVAQAWRPEFAVPVRAYGLQQAQSPHRDVLRNGTNILSLIGTKDELPALLNALEQRIPLTVKTPRWQTIDDSDREGWPLQDDCLTLIRAAQKTLREGALLPVPPRTAAEAALLLRVGTENQNLRPADWEALRLKLLRHEVPFIRQLALESLAIDADYPRRHIAPAPMKPELLALMPDLLTDRDPSAREAACKLVDATKERRLKASVLEVVRTGKNRWVLNSAAGAAHAISADYEAWLIWAERLDEPGMMRLAIENLATVIQGKGGYGWSEASKDDTGRLLKPKWQQFLKQHRARLQAGKLLATDDPELSPDLFPKEFHVTVGTKEWPPRQ